MVEPFLCEVCGESFTEPVLMPCCSACVCAAHVSAICPHCDSQIDPSNVKPNNLLRLYLNQSSDCDRCSSKPALLHCSSCQTFLCKDCCSTIHSLGVYRKHTLVPIDKGKSLLEEHCFMHSHRKISHFCTDDWESMCVDCIQVHESHSVMPLDSLLDDAVREIAAKETQMREKLTKSAEFCTRVSEKMMEIGQFTEKSKTQIKGQFQHIREQLAAKEEEMVRSLDSQISGKMRELLSISKESSRNRQKLEGIVSLLAFAKEKSAGVLVSSLKYLSDLLEELPETPNFVPTIYLGNFTLQSSKTSEISRGISGLSLEDQKDVESGSISTRIFSNTASASDLHPERTQRQTSKSSKSPLSRQATNFKAEFVGSPLTKTPAKVAVTPRTPYRPVVAHTKLTEDTAGNKTYASLCSALDDAPLGQRVFVRKAQSTSSIQVSWNHPLNPPSSLNYVLEYGVGTKIGSIEQFRQVYKGTARTCIITDLLPKTSYRFRVAPVAAGFEEQGEWSEVATITTLDQQGIDPASCGQHAIWTSRGSERFLTFEKAGIVTGLNPVLFGKSSWEVRFMAAATFAQEDSPSALKIGVIVGKAKVVLGSTVIYSGKAASKVRICLDADSRTLICYTPTHPQGEQFPHLPEGPLFPALMNKPGRTAMNVKVWVSFDLPFDVST